ncbi:MAG: FAD-dependent oxidoreductase [Solirubrobacterales bacterium]
MAADRTTTGTGVVGAGLAGLWIARKLDSRGTDYLLLDKGRTPGGRMATRRFEGGLFDHGLPVLEDGRLTESLAALGTTAGLLNEVDLPTGSGWYSREGLSALGKQLAEGLAIEMSCRVGEACGEGDSVILPVEPEGDREGGSFEIEVTGSLVVTAPLPQAQEIAGPLFGEPLTSLPNPYSACLVGLAVLDSEIGLPGGPLVRSLEDKPPAGFDSFVLEFLKFPDRKPGVSLRVGPEESARLFDSPEEEQLEFLMGGFRELGLEPDPATVQVKKWRYSKPATPSGESHLKKLVGGVEVFVAGDSFSAGSGTPVECALTSAESVLGAS